MTYYNDCEQFIIQHGMQDAVRFNGHVNITQALAERRVGYMLSVSESDFGLHGFESFHLAVADGFAANGISLIRRWPGAEYLWPQQFLVDSEKGAVERILCLAVSEDVFRSLAAEGRTAIKSNYPLEKFVESVVELYREVL